MRIHNKLNGLTNGNTAFNTEAQKLASKLENALHLTEEQKKSASQNDAEEVKHSLQRLEDGTEYVLLDENTDKTDREVFNELVGTPLYTSDGDVILIVKSIPGVRIFNELMRRLPRWNRDMSLEELKQVNHEVNQNIADAIENSSLSRSTADTDERHAKNGIVGFDTRSVTVANDRNAYDFDVSVAVLDDGRKIGYAKKYLGTNPEVWSKIKEAETRSTTSPQNQL